jgi:hypothetical protein
VCGGKLVHCIAVFSYHWGSGKAGLVDVKQESTCFLACNDNINPGISHHYARGGGTSVGPTQHDPI